MNRVEEFRRAAASDHAFFASHPDRNFRMRRAYDCEMADKPPTGYAIFCALHRSCVGNSGDHEFFCRRRDFRTPSTDAEIREFLR